MVEQNENTSLPAADAGLRPCEEIFVICTIDFPEDWYVYGVASSRQKAEEILRADYPFHVEWEWYNVETIYALDPSLSGINKKRGWSVCRHIVNETESDAQLRAVAGKA